MKPSGQPERIFHTGRNEVTIFMMVFGALFLAFGFTLLILTWREEKENLGPLALVLVVFILGGGWACGGSLLVFLRETLAIYPEGAVIANWSGRQTLIPWSDLDGVVVAGRAGRWVRAGAYSASTLTLYLLAKVPSGERTRLEVARIGSAATSAAITSALAAHADLVYVGDQQPGLNADEVAWRKRPSATAEPTPQRSLAPEASPAVVEAAPVNAAEGESAEKWAAGALDKPHGPPERVFHTGRTTAVEFYIYFPLLFALFGTGILFTAWAGEGTAEQLPSLKHLAELSAMTAFGWPMVVGGICISIIHMVNYLRSALAVHVDGLMFRDWLGRRRFIPWSNLEGVVVSYKVAAGDEDVPDTPYVRLFLMLRLRGGTRRLKVSLARRWEPMYADITSTLAQRANLEYLGRNEGQEVWRRRPDSAGS